jgi:hypothetical protein
VFTGHRCGEASVRDDGLSRPEYPASDSGWFEKRGEHLSERLWLPLSSLIPSCLC